MTKQFYILALCLMVHSLAFSMERDPRLNELPEDLVTKIKAFCAAKDRAEAAAGKSVVGAIAAGLTPLAVLSTLEEESKARDALLNAHPKSATLRPDTRIDIKHLGLFGTIEMTVPERK